MGTAWIAIAGTVIGASITFLYQRLTLRRTENFTRAEQLRGRRIDAYSDFAEKVMDWRRAHLIRRRYQLRGDAEEGGYEPLREESQRLRTQTWSAYYKVKLLCGDDELERLAAATVRSIDRLWEAEDRRVLEERADAVRDHLDLFLAAAADQTVGSHRRKAVT